MQDVNVFQDFRKQINELNEQENMIAWLLIVLSIMIIAVCIFFKERIRTAYILGMYTVITSVSGILMFAYHYMRKEGL